MEVKSGTLGQMILSSLLAGGIFVAFLVVTNALVPALLVAVGVYVAGQFLFRPPRKLKVQVSGLTPEIVEQALEAGKAQKQEILRLGGQIADARVRADALSIAEVYQELLEDIRKDPKDLKTARSFLNYYPDAVIRILTRYTGLQGKNLRDPGITDSLAKTEGMLSTIHRAFEKQLAQLQQDDVMDLDTELELLRRTMASEGLDQGSEKS